MYTPTGSWVRGCVDYDPNMIKPSDMSQINLNKSNNPADMYDSMHEESWLRLPLPFPTLPGMLTLAPVYPIELAESAPYTSLHPHANFILLAHAYLASPYA